MKKIFFKAVAVVMPMAAMTVSCVEEQMNDTPVVSDVEFFAASETTRTGLNSDMKTVEWKVGDKVSIFAGEDNLLYTAASAGTSTGFVASAEGVKTDAGSVWAVYPYSEDIEKGDGSVTVTIPSVHNVSAEGFAQDANVTVAYCPELKAQTQLAFKNVCSYMKVTLAAEQGVKGITLSSDANVALAGTATVKMDESGNPEIVSVSDPVTSVSLSSETALDGTFLMPVLPGEAAVWTLAFVKMDGTESTVAVGNEAASFVRNTPLAYDFSGASINWKVAPSAVTADKVFWSDAHVSWTHAGKVDAYKVYADDQLVAEVENGVKTAHLTGLANGTSYNIKVAAVYGTEEKVSEEIEITTGAITQLTKNVSPTSVAVAIENRAGNVSGNFSPCLYVQLFESDDVNSTPKYEAYVLDSEKQSQGTPFFGSLVVGNGKPVAHTNVAFGALTGSTDYYFRVKSVASYEYTEYQSSSRNTVTATSQNGDSDYSELVKLSTSPVHELASDEVLFQGFDDCSMEADFINCAVGIMPAFKAEGNALETAKYPGMFSTWDKGWIFYGLRTGLNKSDIYNCGWMSQMTTSGEYKLYTVGSVAGKPCLAPDFAHVDDGGSSTNSRIGSFAANRNFANFLGWNITNKCFPHEGYMALGQYYTTSDAVEPVKAAIMTCSMTNNITQTPTACVISFKALAVQGRTGVLELYYFDGSKSGAANWTKITDFNIRNSNGETVNAEEWSGYSDTHRWYEHSVEYDLKHGDYLGFGTDGNACICIDDICVKIK